MAYVKKGDDRKNKRPAQNPLFKRKRFCRFTAANVDQIDYKDVVKSIKATLKKFGSTIKGITTLYKNYDTAPLLISRAYEVFKTFTEKKDEHVAEFRRLLLDKGFWNENIKRLPADLGAHVASFLNLPKGLMKDIIDRRNNK